MTTPNPTQDKLLGSLSHLFLNLIGGDMKDPQTWEEAGIDLDDFTDALRKHGTRIDVSLTFSKLTDSKGQPLGPMETGILGKDPEHFVASVQMDRLDFRG